jgi:hypothetical protein
MGPEAVARVAEQERKDYLDNTPARNAEVQGVAAHVTEQEAEAVSGKILILEL